MRRGRGGTCQQLFGLWSSFQFCRPGRGILSFASTSIRHNALVRYHGRCRFGAAEYCQRLEAYSSGAATHRSESVLEHMAGRCEDQSMEQVANVLDR